MTWTDEHSPSARRPPRWLLVACVAVVAVALTWSVIVITRSDGRDDIGSPSTNSGAARPSVDRTGATMGTVDAQQAALDQRDRGAFMRTWAPNAGSQQAASRIFTNLSGLDTAVELQVNASDQEITGLDPAALWPVEVDVTWHLPHVSNRAAVSKLSYTFEHRGAAGAKVIDVSAAPGGLAPLWLNEPLVVRRGPGWTVAADSAAGAATLARVTPEVLNDVQDVLSDPSSNVVFYLPGSVDVMIDVVGTSAAGLEGIAAVTASADGSQAPRTPLIVVLNPDELGRLDRHGREVILAHEATHAVTGAGVFRMPVWLAEGFADYVGLRVADVPVSVAAKLAVRDARANGVPRSLPTAQAFAGSRGDVEIAYEQAWLAVRTLVRQFGAPAVLRFYHRVVTEPQNLRRVVRSELGVGLDEVTSLWRAELRRLADA